MREDLDSRDHGVHMEDPVWRLLNGFDYPGDDWPQQPTTRKTLPCIIAIICIGVVPPLILLASEFLF